MKKKIPVTVYSNMMKTSYDMNMFLSLVRQRLRLLKQKSQIQVRKNPNPGKEKPNPGKNDNTDNTVARKYTRLADLLYPNGGTSMVFSKCF